MLVAVAGFALLPLLIWLGTRDMSVWVFVGMWYALRGTFWLGIAQIGFPRTADRRRDIASGGVVMLKDLKVIKVKYLIADIVCSLEWIIFAAALTLADPSVVTVVFELWPILFALLTFSSYWRRYGLKENKNQQSNKESESRVSMMMVMLVVGAVGTTLVVLSDSEEGLFGWDQRALLGLLLAVLAAVFAAISTMIDQLMGIDQKTTAGPNRVAAFTAVSGTAFVRSLLVPVFIGIGLLFADSGDTYTQFGLMIVVCVGFVHIIAHWCLIYALNLASEKYKRETASINTLYYMRTIVALLLLAGFAGTDIARPDLLIAGTIVVVAVNMVMHLDPEGTSTRQGQGGYGYRALVLALWVSGVLVLFRDDWVPDNWQVWSVVEYWGILGLLATVFILVYSFRQSRVGDLRRDADELMLGLHHEFNVMRLYSEARGASDTTGHMSATECMERLRVIDRSSGKSFNDAYLELRRDLEGRTVAAVYADDTVEANRWSKLLVDVERLVGLRQQGRGFAEPAVLAMFAAVTAALAVVARPENTLEPFARWIHDSVSVTIAAAFLFLGFDLVDKRRAADTPVFRKVGETAQKTHGQPPGWRLELLFYEDRRVPQLITTALGAVLLIGAIAMLGFKWMT